MIKLISLDLDGTLLDPKGKITAASREAVARAKAAGLRVVINTGRPVQEAVCFAREAGCDLLVSGAGWWGTAKQAGLSASGTCPSPLPAGPWSCA